MGSACKTNQHMAPGAKNKLHNRIRIRFFLFFFHGVFLSERLRAPPGWPSGIQKFLHGPDIDPAMQHIPISLERDFSPWATYLCC